MTGMTLGAMLWDVARDRAGTPDLASVPAGFISRCVIAFLNLEHCPTLLGMIGTLSVLSDQ